MPISKIDLVAGKVSQFRTQHKYFLILSDGGSPLNITRQFKGGGVESLEGVAEGFGLKIVGGNENYFDFVSANNKTIQIYTGNDEATYVKPAPTTVSVSGNVGVTNFPATQVVSGQVEVINEVEIKNSNGPALSVARYHGQEVINVIAGALKVTNAVQDVPVSMNGTVMIQNLDTVAVLRVMPKNQSLLLASSNVGFRVEPQAVFECECAYGGFSVCLETAATVPAQDNLVYIYSDKK